MPDGESRVPTPLRIPLAVPITTRDGVTGVNVQKDAYIQNGFIEKHGNLLMVYPRPGALQFTTFVGGGFGTTQGLTYQNGFLYAAADNALTRISSPSSLGFTTGGGWTNAFNGPWQGRRSHCSVVFKGALYIFGGTYDGTNILKDIWSTQDGQHWTQVVAAAPWGARAFQKAVVFNNRLYVMGGIDSGSNRLNDVWVSDDGVNWSQVTLGAAWSPRVAFGCVVFNNGIYVYGGLSNSGEMNDVWFSTDGSNFTQVPVVTAFPATDGFGAVAFAGKLWVIGGFTGVNSTNEVWSSPDGATWTRTTAAAFADSRTAFGCTVYNGAMWVVAGNHITAGSFLRTNVYSSTDGITWTQATAGYGGAAIFGCTLEVFKSPPGVSAFKATTMYLLGGASAVPAYLNLIWYANVDGTLNTTWSIPSSASPAEDLYMTPINDNQYFCMKDSKGLYVLYQNQLTKVSDVNYPQTTVPGLVNLDETLYVMTPDALIMGSAIGDPFTWPSRNFLGADYENDAGVALAKYQNYVVAFGVTTTQFFYDSGIPPVLLRPNKNMNLKIGCAVASSVVATENNLAWLGRTQSKQLRAYMMDGGALRTISTSWVERILNLNPGEPITGDYWQRNGKSYIVYSLGVSGITLVYDIDLDWWYQWTTASLGYFAFRFYATDGTADYLIQSGKKVVVSLGEFSIDDLGASQQPVVTTIQTERFDGGNDLMKPCTRVTIIGDNYSNPIYTGDKFQVSYSDDDYVTYSTPRDFVLGGQRLSDTRFGRFRRRAWRVSYSSVNQTMPRVQGLELELGQGSG